MNLPTVITKIFSNKYFLYLMVFLALTNTIGFMILGNINAIIYFILFALFTAIFSRNMSIVLFVALICTNLITVNMITKEGFEDKKIVEKKETEEKPAEKEKPLEQEKSTEPDGYSMGTGTKKISGSKVDYAATVENAYDNLNKILGGDGMKRLTDDTQQLMKKQQQLASSMEAMTPLIQNITPLLNQTKDLLGNVDMKNIDQIASLFTSLTGKNT